jgi:hypothetical protein
MDDQYHLLFEKIAHLYISATPFQRSNMRQQIQKNKDVRQALIWWHPKMEETHPRQYLRLCLVSISLQDGLPDFRDILLSLVGLWNHSEKKGIAPTPFYTEAVEWGGGSAALISQVMDPERRQRIIRKP